MKSREVKYYDFISEDNEISEEVIKMLLSRCRTRPERPPKSIPLTSNPTKGLDIGKIFIDEATEEPKYVICDRCGCGGIAPYKHYCIGSSQQPGESGTQYKIRKLNINKKYLK